MNPTCRRLMRYRERHAQVLPLLRNRPEGSAWGSWPERQTQKGGNRSAYACASAALKSAVLQCIARRYCVTLGVSQLAVDTGGRPHKC
jgi:hypothetical protein